MAKKQLRPLRDLELEILSKLQQAKRNGDEVLEQRVHKCWLEFQKLFLADLQNTSTLH